MFLFPARTCRPGWRRLNLTPFLLLACLTTSLALLLPSEPIGGQDAVPSSDADSFATAIQTVLAVKPEGGGHVEAMAAINRLADSQGAALLPVLQAMGDASPLAKNWLRGLAAELLEQQTASAGQLPLAELEKFFADRSNDPDARYLVYRWLTSDDSARREAILETASDDPSLPLRYLANERLIQLADEAGEAGDEQKKSLYSRVLADARNPDQLQRVAKELQSLGREVDLASELGMFTSWYLTGPFDNTDGAGFDPPAGPEESLLKGGAERFDPEQAFAGKAGQVGWQKHVSQDPMGLVDLNAIFDNAKDATTYAYCVFEAKQATEVEARLGSINANKVWVNGQLVTANEVYHAGSRIDQYVANCQLRPGTNWVLIKICQNAQTESWAQDWQFQFRITDAMGKPSAVAPQLFTTEGAQ